MSLQLSGLPGLREAEGQVAESPSDWVSSSELCLLRGGGWNRAK